MGLALLSLSIGGLYKLIHARRSNYRWSYAANIPPGLIITCPSSSHYIPDLDLTGGGNRDGSGDGATEELRRKTPSADLLRWQRPWTRSTLCGLSPDSVPDGFVSLPDTSTTYEAFHLINDASVPNKMELHPIQPVTNIPAECLDAYLSIGLPCPCIPTPVHAEADRRADSTASHGSDSPEVPNDIDIVWTWVNGSEPLHVAELDVTRIKYGYTPSPKLFRYAWHQFLTPAYSFELL